MRGSLGKAPPTPRMVSTFSPSGNVSLGKTNNEDTIIIKLIIKLYIQPNSSINAPTHPIVTLEKYQERHKPPAPRRSNTSTHKRVVPAKPLHQEQL